MNPLVLEELSPSYIRERRIDLTLHDGLSDSPPTPPQAPSAFAPILLDVSYSRCLPEGVMLPLLLEVQGPSSTSYQQRIFSHAAPTSVIFTPREGGKHLVTLREACHNRWFASLRLDVAGELLEPTKLL